MKRIRQQGVFLFGRGVGVGNGFISFDMNNTGVQQEEYTVSKYGVLIIMCV